MGTMSKLAVAMDELRDTAAEIAAQTRALVLLSQKATCDSI
jgi:hypothetical protein